MVEMGEAIFVVSPICQTIFDPWMSTRGPQLSIKNSKPLMSMYLGTTLIIAANVNNSNKSLLTF